MTPSKSSFVLVLGEIVQTAARALLVFKQWPKWRFIAICDILNIINRSRPGQFGKWSLHIIQINRLILMLYVALTGS